MKEKSFERKAELLEAALDEFITKNYEDASLNNIIRNAKISKGTFYYHFQDKQALYLFLLECSVRSKWEFVNDKINEYTEEYEGKDIFEKFKIQARIGAEFAIVFPKFHRLSKMFTKEKGNKVYDIAKGILGSDTEKLLEEMIDKAIENGDFKKEFSKEFIVKTVSYLFIRFDEIFYTQEDFELEKMIENLDNYVDFMKGGLGK
ncbi:TetR/AcrR family transcriptional regulator [Clostridium sp. MSJ-11]|uniref:TetR/AcrR family transcriptional regulator n=1 Tax=Clostridium mobile TaxID=2841512 RepID=A0ABS6EG46_9CLOT|nr:TetR/AcrR family transcriptional regulator [Clostridium mobile]MBU5484193.1 TetR/AcrR family transcriptional regulator [Clostridium mobile]